MTIKQGTPEWLEEKKKYIGASEIYGLAHHYCQSELMAIGIDIFKEKPFTTAAELFLKIKYDFNLERTDSEASRVTLAFGSAMEDYVFKRLRGELNANHDHNQIELSQKHDFIINPDFHKYAACSPDGYINLVGDRELPVKGLGNYNITKEMGEGVVELKTMRSQELQGLLDENVGAPAKYMLQNQYQMMVTGKKWGVISILLPREYQVNVNGGLFSSDGAFFKGIALSAMNHDEFEYLYSIYDLVTFAHPVYEQYQNIINKSLKLFCVDLKNDNEPIIYNNHEAVTRVRKMMEQIRPEGFDTLKLKETDELDQLINSYCEAHAKMKDEQSEKEEIGKKIIKLTKERYSKIIGTEYKVSYSVKGTMIFNEIK